MTIEPRSRPRRIDVERKSRAPAGDYGTALAHGNAAGNHVYPFVLLFRKCHWTDRRDAGRIFAVNNPLFASYLVEPGSGIQPAAGLQLWPTDESNLCVWVGDQLIDGCLWQVKIVIREPEFAGFR